MSSGLVSAVVTVCAFFFIQSSNGQEWSSWVELPCSKTCGGGRQLKTRLCIGGLSGGIHCPGLNQIETICNLNICPLGGLTSLANGNGLLGPQREWSQWIELPCSKTCGGGRRRKTRICIGGTNCPGLPEIESVCNIELCPLFGLGQIGHLGEWSQWTDLPCSAVCGGGLQRRQRICIGGTRCLGLKETEKVCNLHACPLGLGGGLGLHGPLHTWTQWTGWTACSALCGGGKQQRSRVCLGGVGKCLGLPSKERLCNLHLCG